MARVVQRSSPPYLTVLFVFLFFIATAAAAWFYNSWRGGDKLVSQRTASLEAMATSREQSDDAMTAIKDRARTENRKRTVIGQYRQDVSDLLLAISGAPDTPIKQVMVTVGDVTDNGGLLGQVARLQADLTSARQSVARLESDFNGANSRLASERAAATEMKASLEAERQNLSDQLAASQAQVTDLSTRYDEQVKRAAGDWNGRVQEQESMLATRDDEIRKLEKTIRDHGVRIIQLQDKLNKQSPDAQADVRADGMIVNVVGDQVVYIDIGRRDRLQMGLPFAVYSKRTGVGADVPIKAKIIVTNVHNEIAECRVLDSKTSDPIVENDLIASIAFDATRTPTFVVEGDFDLDADGIPDFQSNELLRAMIQRFGGAVVDTVDVNVDYLVMGEPPSHTPRPGAEATPDKIAQWEEAQAKVGRYHDIKAEAIKLSKPVLNTKQFLSFIGYAPEVLTR